MLLIVIAIVGASLVYSFAAGYITQLMVQGGEMDNIKIDMAYLGEKPELDKIWVVVRNSDLDRVFLVNTVYILDSEGVELIATVTNLNCEPPNALSNGLEPGQVVKLYKQGSNLYDLTVGKWYTLKVVTTGGGQAIYKVICSETT